MNSVKNHVQLLGNLGGTPQVRTLEGGKKTARFSMATSEKYKNNKGEPITETYWHTLVVWGPLAERAERWLDKGSEVVVSGRLVSRTYTDKSGIKRFITEVHVHDFMITSRSAA